jgi:NAD(P)-dependent dehydrogenase (short-subunit alcohol dehydrogenase family)
VADTVDEETTMSNESSQSTGNDAPQVVVVTGASAGVGRATVRALAKRGAHIGLLARGEEGLEAARHEVEAMGGRAIAIPTDVADPEAVEAAAARVEEAFGPIDVWVNNAMNSVFSPVKEMQADEYKRVTEVTYLGYVYGVQSALKRMLPRDRGVIIQVGSALAYRGIPLQSAYCAAKHAIQGFTDSLRCELIHDESNVRVTSVHLAAINTPQFRWVKSRLPRKAQPVPPIFQPEVAAEAILFAIDNDRREVWVGNPTVKTIVGNRVAPWYLDRRLAHEAWDGQMIDEPYEPRPDNLWEPVPGDHGAHGEFGDRADDTSWQLWATKNRGLLAIAGAAVVSVGAAALAANGRMRDGGRRHRVSRRFRDAADWVEDSIEKLEDRYTR